MANMAGSKTWKVGLLYVLAFAVLFVMVFPYWYMVLGSLAPWNEVDRKLIPSSLTLRSYE
ncbi:sugar ABC transporter permease [Geobacillus thermoleovorans B23]|nr:sugar ABC transporter permease [Geobacillus thermoleovorans B23]